MTKPVLVVLAAGMGSRYGGMKQLDPVGPNGQIIIDYSIFDARRAGFETVIFIIRRENDAAFRAAIGDRLSHLMEVKYAYQELSDRLEEGSIDAACMDGSIAHTYDDFDRSLLDFQIDTQSYGVATQKDSALSQPVAEAVQAMLDDGTVARFIDKWN